MINKKDIEMYYHAISIGADDEDAIQGIHDYLITSKIGVDLTPEEAQAIWEHYMVINRGVRTITLGSFYRDIDLPKIEEKMMHKGFVRGNSQLDEEFNNLHLYGEFEKVMYRDDGWEYFSELYNIYKTLTSRNYYVAVNDEPKQYDLDKHTFPHIHSDEEYYLLDDLLEHLEPTMNIEDYDYTDMSTLKWLDYGMLTYVDRLTESFLKK